MKDLECIKNSRECVTPPLFTELHSYAIMGAVFRRGSKEQ